MRYAIVTRDVKSAIQYGESASIIKRGVYVDAGETDQYERDAGLLYAADSHGELYCLPTYNAAVVVVDAAVVDTIRDGAR